MEALLSSLVLGFGSAASPCLLPLYPAFVAFLVGRNDGSATSRSPALLGLVVVLGVVTALILVGAVVTVLSLSLGSLLAFVVPVTTVVLVLLGVLMLAGQNPFARMATIRMPVVRRPLAQAYVYGLLVGPGPSLAHAHARRWGTAHRHRLWRATAPVARGRTVRTVSRATAGTHC